MTLAQAKKKAREMHKGKRHTENYYLIKYPLIGWIIGTLEEFSTSNSRKIDSLLYTLDAL